jgi:hypothetical protein
MKPMMRVAVIAVLVALTSLACGSSGANAAESQSAASEFLKGLSKMAAKQTFTGTVVATDTAAGEVVTDDNVIGKSTTKTSLNSSVTLTVTANGVVANVTYASKTLVETEARYQSHRVVGSKTEETTASGHNRENASVTIDLRSDGTYQINFSAGGVTGEYRMNDTAVTICNAIEGSTCRPGKSSSEDSGKPQNVGGLAGSVDGTIDRTQPNVLRGTVAQRHELNDGSTATRTVTWNLSRAK